METVEYLSNFLRRIGTHNFLVIGIAIIVAWLLFAGLRRGLKKKKYDEDDENEES
jgi:hypothetical protein